MKLESFKSKTAFIINIILLVVVVTIKISAAVVLYHLSLKRETTQLGTERH